MFAASCYPLLLLTPRLKRGEEQLMSIPFLGAKVELTFTAVDFGQVVEVPQPAKKKAPQASTNEMPPPPSKEEVEALFVEVAVCCHCRFLHFVANPLEKHELEA
jgi:hypothetical protein